jgi:hypothetical protein
VLGTSVPDATIERDGDPLSRKRDVYNEPKVWHWAEMRPIAKASAVEL